MAKLALVIDVARCIGCRSCVAACKLENMVPKGSYWNYVIEYEEGEYPAVKRTFVPINCQHCEEPACMKACPENAIYKNEYGIVLIDYNKCKGRRYCIAACPYGVIHYIGKKETLYPDESTPYEDLPESARHPLHRIREGIATKCTLCWHRLEKAMKEGKTLGEDYDSTPACVPVCPAEARFFGDLDDPNSEVSKLIKERNGKRLKEEFGTKPQLHYLF